MKRNAAGYVIRISENAIMQMVLGGLEAYCVHHQKGARRKRRLETYGLLWGHEIAMPDKRRLFCVEFFSVDTSTDMRSTYCIPNNDSLTLKREVLTSFWPQYDFIGDFHTHPQRKGYQDEVRRRKLYEFSAADIDSIEQYSDNWLVHNYRVGLVLTITQLERMSTRDHLWLNNSTIEFSMGTYRMWIKGYVAHEVMREKQKRLQVTDEDVLLDCPAIIGLAGAYTDFKQIPIA